MPRCRVNLRVNLSTVTFLLVLQGAVVVLFCGWYVQLHPCVSLHTPGRVHVLLLSSWRSGSSFLGQVFSQNPSVFYLMEPAWHIWTTLQRGGAQGLRGAVRDLLHNTFLCDLSTMEAYLSPPMPTNPPHNNLSQLFMWSHSRALCSPPACPLTPLGHFSNQTLCAAQCGDKALSGAQHACQSYSHIVLKEVRFFELESLFPLLRDPRLDLRIVHLVRDPRAVLRSREESSRSLTSDSALVLEHRNVSSADLHIHVLQEICRSHMRIRQTAMQAPPPFLQGRYKLVRYEDLARHPLEEISSIYNFVGLEMTPPLQEWIYRVTHGKGKGTKKEAFKITSRNAEDVAQAWRTMLSHNKVRRVQDVCREAMSLLGYRRVNNDREQKKLDIDLLVPREPYQFSWLPEKTEPSKLKP